MHGSSAFISQHIGDLETAPAFRAFENVIESFERLYEIWIERSMRGEIADAVLYLTSEVGAALATASAG